MPARARPTAAALRRQAERAIREAEAGRSRLPPAVLALEGLSSPTVRHFMNNVCRFATANYLEVGTWKGSTLISASYGNPGSFTAVDDFSLRAQPAGEGQDARTRLRQVRRRFAARCHTTFHESNCWSHDLLQRLPREVNVYFYDGPHGFSDQYKAFTHFEPLLARDYLAVVDDWNRPGVRAATRDAIADLGHSVAWEREFFTRGWHVPHITGSWPPVHWFNGLLVAVLRKPGRRAA